jgi:hypothetical protein
MNRYDLWVFLAVTSAVPGSSSPMTDADKET